MNRTQIKKTLKELGFKGKVIFHSYKDYGEVKQFGSHYRLVSPDEDFLRFIENVCMGVMYNSGGDVLRNKEFSSSKELYEMWNEVCDFLEIPSKVKAA